MARKAAYPERFQFKAPEGSLAAVQAALPDGQEIADALREALAQWLAARRIAVRKGNLNKQDGVDDGERQTVRRKNQVS